jgi:hypothetical protein
MSYPPAHRQGSNSDGLHAVSGFDQAFALDLAATWALLNGDTYGASNGRSASLRFMQVLPLFP